MNISIVIVNYISCIVFCHIFYFVLKWKKLNFEEELYNFFDNELQYCNNNYKPFFTNNFCNFNKLLTIVNKYIEPEYDLNIFYENTLFYL